MNTAENETSQYGKGPIKRVPTSCEGIAVVIIGNTITIAADREYSFELNIEIKCEELHKESDHIKCCIINGEPQCPCLADHEHDRES